MRIHRLLQSLNGKSAEKDPHLVEEVAQIIGALDVEGCLSRYQLLAQELLRAVIRELAIPVRVQLANKICNEMNAPREILMILANDAGEVAHPILQNHLGLRDIDLVEVVLNQTHQHRLAVASRNHLNEIVATALTCFGEYDVIETVLRNRDAQIGEQAFTEICKIAKGRPELQKRLIERADLPVPIAFGMLDWVIEPLLGPLHDLIERPPNALKLVLAHFFKENALTDSFPGSTRHRIEQSTKLGAGWLADDVVLVINAISSASRDIQVALASDYTGERFRSMRAVILSGDIERFAKICRDSSVPTKAFTVMVECMFKSTQFKRKND